MAKLTKSERFLRDAGANIAESISSTRAAWADDHKGVDFGRSVESMTGVKRLRNSYEIPVDKITVDPDQPRKVFDEESLALLAEDFKKRGQLQPCVVRWDPGANAYVLIAGERRYRAALLAGLPALKCLEYDRPFEDHEDILLLQLVENCLREDLGPLEQAQAFSTLMTKRGWTARELGKELGIAHTTVGRAVKLLDLTPAVRRLVEGGSLNPRVAAEIARLPDAEAQARVAADAVENLLTREEVAATVNAMLGRPKVASTSGVVSGTPPAAPPTPPKPADPERPKPLPGQQALPFSTAPATPATQGAYGPKVASTSGVVSGTPPGAERNGTHPGAKTAPLARAGAEVVPGAPPAPGQGGAEWFRVIEVGAELDVVIRPRRSRQACTTAAVAMALRQALMIVEEELTAQGGGP